MRSRVAILQTDVEEKKFARWSGTAPALGSRSRVRLCIILVVLVYSMLSFSAGASVGALLWTVVRLPGA